MIGAGITYDPVDILLNDNLLQSLVVSNVGILPRAVVSLWVVRLADVAEHHIFMSVLLSKQSGEARAELTAAARDEHFGRSQYSLGQAHLSYFTSCVLYKGRKRPTDGRVTEKRVNLVR